MKTIILLTLFSCGLKTLLSLCSCEACVFYITTSMINSIGLISHSFIHPICPSFLAVLNLGLDLILWTAVLFTDLRSVSIDVSLLNLEIIKVI